MLKPIPFRSDADHVIALELDGKVEKTDIENVLAAVEEKLGRHDKLRIYIEIKSLGGVAPRALLDDLKAALKHWDRFEKEAIVTDISAITTVVPWLDKVFPVTELKVFEPSGRESAHQWVIA
jgi:hypothetical protein